MGPYQANYLGAKISPEDVAEDGSFSAMLFQQFPYGNFYNIAEEFHLLDGLVFDKYYNYSKPTLADDIEISENIFLPIADETLGQFPDNKPELLEWDHLHASSNNLLPHPITSSASYELFDFYASFEDQFSLDLSSLAEAIFVDPDGDQLTFEINHLAHMDVQQFPRGGWSSLAERYEGDSLRINENGHLEFDFSYDKPLSHLGTLRLTPR